MQMGYFVHRFYEGKGVTANDVGAIDYLADIHLYDIIGLANIDVLHAVRANRYDRTVVMRQMEQRQVRVVMIYDFFATQFGGPLPGWIPVGRWTIRDNVICASDTVTFYAPDDALVPELVRALQKFAASLPALVVQSGTYCDSQLPPRAATHGPLRLRLTLVPHQRAEQHEQSVDHPRAPGERPA